MAIASSRSSLTRSVLVRCVITGISRAARRARPEPRQSRQSVRERFDFLTGH
jgi:hypothetical protein